MYEDSQHASPTGNLPLLSPFSPLKWKQTNLRKHVRGGGRERRLLLQPHQCSSHAGTSVPAHLHSGSWSYLCCQHFPRDISSLRAACSYFHQNQRQIASDPKGSRNINSFCGGDHPLCLLCWKRSICMPEIQQKANTCSEPNWSSFWHEASCKSHKEQVRNWPTWLSATGTGVPAPLLINCCISWYLQCKLTMNFCLLAPLEISWTY